MSNSSWATRMDVRMDSLIQKIGDKDQNLTLDEHGVLFNYVYEDLFETQTPRMDSSRAWMILGLLVPRFASYERSAGLTKKYGTPPPKYMSGDTTTNWK